MRFLKILLQTYMMVTYVNVHKYIVGLYMELYIFIYLFISQQKTK